MRAAVLHEIGQDKLEVLDDVEAVGFGPGRVRIRVRATGLCHSDLSAMGGVLVHPAHNLHYVSRLRIIMQRYGLGRSLL